VRLLDVERLACHYPIRGLLGRRTGAVRAVDGVSFSLAKGDVLGIVGESGCGKSTLGKTIAGIQDPTAGTVSLAGEQIASPGQRRAAAVRARLQYVYQDPGAALDPRWTLRRSLHEPLVIHTNWPRERREAKVREIVAAIGLPQPLLERYPHEISGGQQRRVGLARILVLRPQVVILDEPTSGLDVSVQATVLALLRDLRDRFDLTYLLISHDIAVVSSMCNRMAVMYLGRIVETGPTERLLADPQHPYTRSLLAASLRIGGPRLTDRLQPLDEVPDLATGGPGCRFKTRCPVSLPACSTVDPQLTFEGGHGTACLRCGAQPG
jgi:oligopeptide/dipeptide ABC transporter ATP-binding protein